MKIHRAVFLLTAIWELARFCLLFLGVWLTFRQVLQTNSQAIYWLLIFGNGTLLTPAALLFLFVDPQRFQVLLNLARLAKILGLVSALLLVILQPIGSGLRSLSLEIVPYQIAPLSLLLVVGFVDLIVLFLLFSYHGEESTAGEQKD